MRRLCWLVAVAGTLAGCPVGGDAGPEPADAGTDFGRGADLLEAGVLDAGAQDAGALDGDPDASDADAIDAEGDARPTGPMDAATGPAELPVPRPPLPSPAAPLPGIDDGLMALACIWAMSPVPDAIRAPYHELSLRWLPPDCRSTAHQGVDRAAIDHVLFIGDDALLEAAVERDDIDGDVRLASVRGQLARWLGAHLPRLDAPPVDPLDGADWYQPLPDGRVPGNHEHGFSVCATPSAIWHDLDAAVFSERNRIVKRLAPGADALDLACLERVKEKRGPGSLLVVILFGRYDQRDLERDTQWLAFEPEDEDGRRRTLAEKAIDGVRGIKTTFARPTSATTVLVSTLPDWRAGARGMACTADDPDFSEALAALNGELVKHSDPDADRGDAGEADEAERRADVAYDIVLLDEHLITRGARCVEAGEPDDIDPACDLLPEPDALRAGRPPAGERLEKCCWTASASDEPGRDCTGPDRDGHLGMAALFAGVIDALGGGAR